MNGRVSVASGKFKGSALQLLMTAVKVTLFQADWAKSGPTMARPNNIKSASVPVAARPGCANCGNHSLDQGFHHDAVRAAQVAFQPNARPITVVNHKLAAVVTPSTKSWCFRIAPPPRKPIPVRMPAPSRAGSGRHVPRIGIADTVSTNIFSEMIMATAAATQARMVVRIPAGRP